MPTCGLWASLNAAGCYKQWNQLRKRQMPLNHGITEAMEGVQPLLEALRSIRFLQVGDSAAETSVLYTFPSTSTWLWWFCCCQHLWCPRHKYLSGLELPPLCSFTVMPPAATVFLPQHACYALWNNVIWVMLQVTHFWKLVFQLFDKQVFPK